MTILNGRFAQYRAMRDYHPLDPLGKFLSTCIVSEFLDYFALKCFFFRLKMMLVIVKLVDNL